jgi:antitoxin VapB
MALSIKDPEADRLARELAKATGESLTEAVTTALRDRLRMLQGRQKSREDQLAEVMAIVEQYAARRVFDNRSPDEIIGYDEYGLPR